MGLVQDLSRFLVATPVFRKLPLVIADIIWNSYDVSLLDRSIQTDKIVSSFCHEGSSRTGMSSVRLK
jgi:hypothetical protein